MSIVHELLGDAIALQKDGLSPGRISLALSDRWEAEHLEETGKVRCTRSKEGTIELHFPGGEKIVWDGETWHYVRRQVRSALPVDRSRGSPYWYRGGCMLAAALLSLAASARADDIVAVYAAYWAGLPAGEIQIRLHDGAAAYHDEIEIRTTGLPALITRLRGTGIAEGRLAADRPAEPSHYDAIYDLWKRRNSHISMRFVTRAGGVVAERSPDDTSRKPPLGEKFRSNVVDPVTAFERVRNALRAPGRSADGSFTVPVYDGARRFDILGHILPKKDASEGTLRVELTLRAIAGFKGESSEDGDPDDAPRKVDLLVTDDRRMMPLSMTVPVFFMPLVIQFVHFCASPEACPG